MNDFIYHPKQDIDSTDNVKDSYYCISGSGDYLDVNNNALCYKEADKRVCAKKIYRLNNSIKYMIKTGYDKKLFNPVSIYDSEQNRNFLESISRNNNTFQEVNNMVFDLYLKFLKTKNTAYLNQAEREI